MTHAHAVMAKQQAAAFGPDSLTNLHEWFKADGLLYTDTGGTTPVASDGDLVARWNDAGPGGRHATQSTSSKRPLYKTGGPNGKPFVRADGTDDHLAGTASSWTGGHTYFIVYKAHTATASSDYLFCNNSGDGGGIIAGFEGSGMVEYFASPRTNMGTSDSTTWAIYEFVDPATGAASAAQGLKNGTSTETATSATGLTHDRLTLFIQHNLSANPAQADIAELIVYSEGKNSTDRGLVRAYLGAKYGITVI